MIRHLVAAALAATALTLLPSPANAAGEACSAPDYTGPASGSLCLPVPTDRPLVIEGPARLWKMRAFAERLDAQLPLLDVRSGSCSSYANAYCVRVSYATIPEAGGYAGWDWPEGAARPVGGWIQLTNACLPRKACSPEYRRSLVAHEFMHALGFRHHGEAGVIGRMTASTVCLTPEPSAGEWAALHEIYG